MAGNDYSRFFALLKRNPGAEKESMVLQFTNGRTTSLREMTRAEFDEMCDVLQYGTPEDRKLKEMKLKKARSAALLRLGRLGINTIDNWDGVNAFTSSPKIAGKKFYDMTESELLALVPKLESIIRKGGLKSIENEGKETASRYVATPMDLGSIMRITNNKIKS